MVLSNLGGEYLQIGDFANATASFKKSSALDPDSDEAAANTSLALRYQGKYEEAVPFALRAVELNGVDSNWLELGDCYSSLRNRQSEAKNAYLKAANAVERHLQTDATDGPSWMLLALYQVKLGSQQSEDLGTPRKTWGRTSNARCLFSEGCLRLAARTLP
jgi:tetratricopeptide (TPR) repeat protein